MGTPAIKPLLITVPPEFGESLMSVMLRSAEANVFGGLAAILQLARVHRNKPVFMPFSDDGGAAKVADLLSIPDPVLKDMMHPPFKHEGSYDYVCWYGTRIPRRYIEAEAMRVCPSALVSTPYHRSVWTLKPLDFCAECYEPLISSCQKCGTPLSWVSARDIEACVKCLSPLSTPTMGPKHHVDDYCRLASKLVNPYKEIREAALGQFPTPFSDWQAGDVLQAAVECGVAVSNMARDSGLISHQEVAVGDFKKFTPLHLSAGIRFLLGWPHSLTDALQDYIGNNVGGGIRITGSFSKFVLSKSGTPISVFLKEEIPRAIQNIKVARINVVRDEEEINRSGVISISEACRLFKTIPEIVERVRNGGLCERPRNSLWHGVIVFDYTLLSNSFAEYRAGISFNAAAKKLGIPTFFIQYFIDAGLLEAIDDHDARLLAAKSLCRLASVERLAQSLMTLPILRKGSGKPLDEVMMRKFDPRHWTKVVTALMSGEISVFGVKTGALSVFEALRVDAAQVENLLEMAPASTPDIKVSCLSAVRLLGLCDGFIGGAIIAGFLSGVRNGRSIQISLPELQRFSDLFMSTAEAGSLLEMTTKQATKFLNRKQLQPSGYAHRWAIWRRQEVELAAEDYRLQQHSGL